MGFIVGGNEGSNAIFSSKDGHALSKKGSHLSTSNMASSIRRYALSVKYISDFEDVIWKHIKYLTLY